LGKKFPNGDVLENKDANFKGRGTVEVGKYPANGYGLHDMAGNVCEWCWDWYQDYHRGIYDPNGPSMGPIRNFRDGSWRSDGDSCVVANRYISHPTNGSQDLGFRLARNLSK
jgi:formylglycine-generating enzyme required for sulfatase activity